LGGKKLTHKKFEAEPGASRIKKKHDSYLIYVPIMGGGRMAKSDSLRKKGMIAQVRFSTGVTERIREKIDESVSNPAAHEGKESLEK